MRGISLRRSFERGERPLSIVQASEESQMRITQGLNPNRKTIHARFTKERRMVAIE